MMREWQYAHRCRCCLERPVATLYDGWVAGAAGQAGHLRVAIRLEVPPSIAERDVNYDVAGRRRRITQRPRNNEGDVCRRVTICSSNLAPFGRLRKPDAPAQHTVVGSRDRPASHDHSDKSPAHTVPE